MQVVLFNGSVTTAYSDSQGRSCTENRHGSQVGRRPMPPTDVRDFCGWGAFFGGFFSLYEHFQGFAGGCQGFRIVKDFVGLLEQQLGI